MGYKRKISTNVYRSLLSRSGNQCAYPGCPNELFNRNHKLTAQLCHIEPIGETEVRYNPNLTDESVNCYDNLVFLCYKHHVETNDERIYTVSAMKKIKYDHEELFITNPYSINMSHIFEIINDIEDYWRKVEIANNEEHDVPDLKIKIDTQADFGTLKTEILASISSLENLIEMMREGNEDKYWDLFNIGIPNHTNKVKVLIDHAEIKYLEELIKSNPQNQGIRQKLDALRREFLDQAKSACLID
jgi:hypothetical protein